MYVRCQSCKEHAAGGAPETGLWVRIGAEGACLNCFEVSMKQIAVEPAYIAQTDDLLLVDGDDSTDYKWWGQIATETGGQLMQLVHQQNGCCKQTLAMGHPSTLSSCRRTCTAPEDCTALCEYYHHHQHTKEEAEVHNFSLEERPQ